MDPMFLAQPKLLFNFFLPSIIEITICGDHTWMLANVSPQQWLFHQGTC